MDATLVTVSMSARVDLIAWHNDYLKFVAFESKDDAVFFWCLRDDIVPQFTEELCTLSLNPFNNQYYMIGFSLTEKKSDSIEKAKQESESWKHAWCQGRLKYGKEVWKAYYQGVRDEQAGSVYDKEHGQKCYYPEIK